MFNISVRFLVAFFIALPTALASGQFEVKSFEEFALSSIDLMKGYQPNEVLVVFDIDNTLLTMSEDIGSDQWWNWQSEIMKSQTSDSEKLASGLVSLDFGTLLSVQGFLFASLKMREIEPTQAYFLEALQGSGVPTIALTSRGPEFQAATYRELYKYGFNFLPTALPEIEDNYIPRMPYAQDMLQNKYGFTAEEVAEFRLGAPRTVLYQDGVFMTSGQHKGAMLRLLLADRNLKPKLILFVDDHKKNTDAVWAAYSKGRADIYTYRYGYLDDKVNAFSASDKSDVIGRWKQLKPIFEN